MDNLDADFIIETSNLEAEYSVNPSENFACSFELFASGVTWGNIDGELSNQNDLWQVLQSKADTVTVEALSDTVTDNYNDLDGRITSDHSEITNIALTIQSFGDIVSYDAADFATAAQGALADTAVQPGDLATVATTGKYSDLIGTPTLAAVATSGSYDDLIDKPTIPTVNNATLTIQKNGTTVKTFTANASSNVTANITVPTDTSDLTNGAGFITSASLPTDYVPDTREVNGYALSSDITLTALDVGALSSSTTINDLTTTAQQNALNSGATSTNIGQIATNTTDIATINGKIPAAASTLNQLADKQFVNSSIATNTANFIGTFNSVAELEAYSGTLTNNDYAFVIDVDGEGNTVYDRYKYTDATTPPSWVFEYELNNSSFTATQWGAINSGITSADVTLIGTAIQPGDNVSDLINDAGYLTSSDVATVAISGDYSDLINKPTIPAAQVQSDWNQNDSNAVDYIKNKPTIPAGVIVDQVYDGTSANAQSGIAIAAELTNYALSSGLATVATSGLYSDLTGTPTIPTNTSDLNNDSGFITSSALSNYVDLSSAQNITGTKTFVGQKKIAFKQSGSSDKLGFTLYNSSAVEKGYLEYNPSNTVDSVPLMTLGNYATASTGLTHVGFRKYSSISGASGAYNLLAPLISDAKTPFSLTTTYTNFYLPLGFTDGNTTVKTAKSGVVDISTLLPTVPTNISSFTNDAGYITNSALSGYATETWVTNKGYLQNTATGTNALTLLGTATNQSGSINIGYGSSVTNTDSVVIGENAESAYAQTVAIGYQSNANDSSSTAIGYGAYTNYSQATAIGASSQATKAGTVAVGSSAQATQTQANAFGYSAQSTGYGSIALGYGAKSSANYAIQIGNGTNSTASTLAVGFNGTNYQLLDGTTGLIPDARISSNIARTSAIPDISTKQDTLVSGTNIKTINNTSILGSGDIDTKEIFVATYGTTTYQEISDAITAGKIVMCKNSNGNIYTLTYSGNSINKYIFSYSGSDGTKGWIHYCEVDNANTWVDDYSVLADASLSGLSPQGQAKFDAKADTDLSNLSATGKTVIDGQWVSSYKQIDSTTSIHVTKHNLGTTGTGALNYLPADCTTYDYEVFVAVYGATSSSGVSHGYAYNNSTATDGQYGRVTCNANARHGNNSFALPIYNGEMWTSVGTTAFGSSFNVILLGYRRLGTNS